MSVAIEPERPEHRDGVRALLQDTFDGPGEADLVDALRDNGYASAARVAHDSTGIVGYVMFCELGARIGADGVASEARSITAAALAPLAVRKELRGQGIGVSLVHAGLSACRVAGVELVVVLGDPDYYEQFGFSAARAANMRSVFSGPHLMALELKPGVIGDDVIKLTYPPPFGIFEGA